MKYRLTCCLLFFMVIAIEVDAWGLFEAGPEASLKTPEVESKQTSAA